MRSMADVLLTRDRPSLFGSWWLRLLPPYGTVCPYGEARFLGPRRSSTNRTTLGATNVSQPDAALRDPVRGGDEHPRCRLAPTGLGARGGVHEPTGSRCLQCGRAAGGGRQGLLRPRLHPRAGREGPARVRPAGAQPRQQPAHRRGHDGVRVGLRSAVRPRGRRTPRRDHGRLPELHQARPVVPDHGLRGRRDLRAQRHPAGQPAPRHDLRAGDADRQGVHGQRGLRAQREGHHRAHLDPPGRWSGPGGRPGQHGADSRTDLADQLQLPAPLGRPDARLALRVRRGQPGRRTHAVPPDGCDVAGDHSRRPSSSRSPRPSPASPSRS